MVFWAMTRQNVFEEHAGFFDWLLAGRALSLRSAHVASSFDATGAIHSGLPDYFYFILLRFFAFFLAFCFDLAAIFLTGRISFLLPECS